MNKFLYILKEIILYIWQLPQNICGLVLLLFYRKEKLYLKQNGRYFYYTTEMPSGISLGNYIIIRREDTGDTMKHEYGHSVDSRIWGPLYLLVIGIPSGLGNLYDRWFHKSWSYYKRYKWYYNQPWEKSADKKGGVIREFRD